MSHKKLSGLALIFAGVLFATQATAASSARLVRLGTFDSPTYITVAPDEPDLLFVVERRGRIQVLRNEKRLAKPFLDITNLVMGVPDAGAGNEQGLLSIAFPPDYRTSRRFYVVYTNNDGDVEIDEFHRSPNSAVRALPASRRLILVIPHPDAQNHNGGQLQFQNNVLFISVGDGGRQDPVGEHARDLDNLLGKILRIIPLPDGDLPYSVPASNPFVGMGGRDEIFAYGLRNPWRFSIQDGILQIGDVGQNRREEINFLKVSEARGTNFGWPQYEGHLVFDNARPGEDPPKFPIFEYNHNGGRCAIIGGHVVRAANLPALRGRYIYGDSCTGRVFSFIANAATQTISGHRAAGLVLPGLSSIGRGFNGKVYTTQISGEVSRLAPP